MQNYDIFTTLKQLSDYTEDVSWRDTLVEDTDNTEQLEEETHDRNNQS